LHEFHFRHQEAGVKKVEELVVVIKNGLEGGHSPAATEAGAADDFPDRGAVFLFDETSATMLPCRFSGRSGFW
jgi:hypothetical protein